MNQRTWSAGDEEAFQALAKKRDEIRGSQETLVKLVAHSINNNMCKEPVDRSGNESTNQFEARLARAMIAFADELRDALEPFDSGVRLTA